MALRSLLAALCVVFVIIAHVAESAKINSVVVLMLENRPFDHIFGWSSNLGVNGLTGKEFNYANPANTSSEKIFVNSNCPAINDCDPAHGTTATTFKLFAGGKEATNGGFVAYESTSKDLNYCDVMSGFPPERLPVINALASEFAVMDRFFASHPGPTWPNRMFALTGTSAGSTETSVWYHNMRGKLFPQKTIFDQLEAVQLTWRNYYNDTPWELFMEKIAHNPSNLQSMDAFYNDAAEGTLPSFAWINPRSGIDTVTGLGSNDQHPNHDVALGERYIKDIYEALRASPQWEEVLFMVTYDEHGGFYDHVVPPSKDIPPPNDGEFSYPELGFKFDRLGLRVPTLLVSPWIPKGTVISEPPAASKPAASSEFEFSSILSSTRKLLGMPLTPLTDRDAWAATFDYTVDLLEQPRADCPMHLPEALDPVLPASAEAALPLNDLQKNIADVHAHLANVDVPTYTTQGDHSTWVQTHYKSHETRTHHWKSFKNSTGGVNADNYRLITQTCPLYGRNDENNWNVNTASTEPFLTLSSKDLLVEIDVNSSGSGVELDSVPLCLDAGTGKVGTKLSVSPCYPSEDPTVNRDAAQHFVLPGDGSLRFYDPTIADPKNYLCVSNSNPLLKVDESYDVYLRECGTPVPSSTEEKQHLKKDAAKSSLDVTQSWAYHGAAPGDGGSAQFQFGDISNCLGIVAV